jgi:hypothetical protein
MQKQRLDLYKNYNVCSPQVAVFWTPLQRPITKCRGCRQALHGARPVDTQVTVALLHSDHFGAPGTFFVQ